MGKQIFLVATLNDEILMISYLKSIAEIKLVDHFCLSREDLIKDDIQPGFARYGKYYIWNTEFPWNPEYKQNVRGEYYTANTCDTPIIEYCRKNGNSRGDGRIYWSKNFAAPKGLNYDVDKFNKWYETIINWVRKNAAGKENDGRTTYYLPEAWDLYIKCKI